MSWSETEGEHEDGAHLPPSLESVSICLETYVKADVHLSG